MKMARGGLISGTVSIVGFGLGLFVLSCGGGDNGGETIDYPPPQNILDQLPNPRGEITADGISNLLEALAGPDVPYVPMSSSAQSYGAKASVEMEQQGFCDFIPVSQICPDGGTIYCSESGMSFSLAYDNCTNMGLTINGSMAITFKAPDYATFRFSNFSVADCTLNGGGYQYVNVNQNSWVSYFEYTVTCGATSYQTTYGMGFVGGQIVNYYYLEDGNILTYTISGNAVVIAGTYQGSPCTITVTYALQGCSWTVTTAGCGLSQGYMGTWPCE